MNLRSAWPDRGVVWRWHFYAGLFCLPFVVVLAASGTLYLFKAELEAWIDRPHDRLAAAGPARAPAERVAAALAALPGGRLKAFELPVPRGAGTEATTATRVLVDRAGETQRVYVHPGSLAILAVVPERDRLMRRVFRLHGELWLGEHGSHLVELAASWTIVMILTGLVLWWPRQARGLAGVLYPRLRAGRRTAWRDLHAVTGVWISAATLFFLASGLPWAAAWGSYLDLVRRLTGTAAAGRDWSHRGAGRGAHAGHEPAGADAAPPVDGEALDRVVATAAALALDPPVLVAPPREAGRGWSVKSETANRPRRVELVVDGGSGTVVSRRDFRDRHLVDRIVGYGIAAHEGRLFGWPNQLLGLLTAGGLVLVAVSGAVMWWRRRPPGTLGAPPAPGGTARRGGPLVIAAVLVLAVWLPLFGTSLLAVVLLERLVLRRLPRLRDWLGLAG